MNDVTPPSAPPAITEAASFDPAAAGWERSSHDGFLDLVGPVWQRPSGDAYRYAFKAEPKHHNRRGVVQGGMLMTFADVAMGRTSRYANGQRPQATVQLDVHFIDAVRIGEFVEAHCAVVRRTRALMFMSAELKVGDRVVATAKGLWKILGEG
jgi:acyl-coenzyme A thioesterase PaaI-like protein